ncbi:MAG: DoxX family protein [Anaerolineae bacterium]
METFVWVVQILLALAFFMAGIMKLTQPIDKLETRLSWIESINPRNMVRGIGLVEVLGALGLILPAVTGILPVLTPLAAAGLVLTMLGAVSLHVRRGDAIARAMPSVVLLALAVFVAYGRFVAVPLA